MCSPVEPVIYRIISDKEKATDAAVQKAVSKFYAGLMFRAQWNKITSDWCILRTICGYLMELSDKPYQTFVPAYIKLLDLK